MIAVALGFVAWALGIWALGGLRGGSDEAAAVGPEGEGRGLPQTVDPAADPVLIKDEYDWDIFDERILIGYSDNVFTGQVLEKVGNKAAWTSIPNDDEDPHTQYAVKVLDAVKSAGASPVSPGDEAVVDQLGGRGTKTGEIHVAAPVSCDRQVIDAPLESGREYMFATLYDPDKDWHAISAPPAGAVELPGPEEREGFVSAYRRAAEEQVNPLRAEADSCH